MIDKVSILDNLSSNLYTVEDTSYFIKNSESYLKGQTSEESILKNYPFMKDVDLVSFKKDFQKLRTNLLSRKKVKIYTPITASKKLISYLYPIFCKVSGSSIILDPIQDTSIVAGIKFSLDGKIFNLTLDSVNKNK